MAFEDMRRAFGPLPFRGAIRWFVFSSFAVLLLQRVWGGVMIDLFGLTPVMVWGRHWWWQPFTYLFLHGSLWHWLFNIITLWMFGQDLETRWGTPEFIRYFFLTGFGAALCVLVISPRSPMPTIGSSGAVFGMLVAFAMINPDAVIHLFWILPVRAWQAAAFFAFVQFFALSEGGGDNVSRFAHLGGMLAGYLYLRFGWQISHFFFAPWRGAKETLTRWAPKPKKSSVTLHELTDDLAREVDQILDKILKQGVESLTAKEREIMERYSKLKR